MEEASRHGRRDSYLILRKTTSFLRQEGLLQRRLATNFQMPLASGSRLGPYEVTVFIGQGGMGEVYRARDTKLSRDVAPKVLLEIARFAGIEEGRPPVLPA